MILAFSCYLPAANCFALLPLVSLFPRSAQGNALLDYDASRDAVVLVATCDVPAGTEVAIIDDRPNGELLLSTGRCFYSYEMLRILMTHFHAKASVFAACLHRVETASPHDFLMFTAELVKTDKLYTAKKTVFHLCEQA